jgi:hypothetical protein
MSYGNAATGGERSAQALLAHLRLPVGIATVRHVRGSNLGGELVVEHTREASFDPARKPRTFDGYPVNYAIRKAGRALAA